jgi:hypothetical protein
MVDTPVLEGVRLHQAGLKQASGLKLILRVQFSPIGFGTPLTLIAVPQQHRAERMRYA